MLDWFGPTLKGLNMSRECIMVGNILVMISDSWVRMLMLYNVPSFKVTELRILYCMGKQKEFTNNNNNYKQKEKEEWE